MNLIDSMAKRLRLTLCLYTDFAAVCCANGSVLFAVRMSNSVRLYGPSHVCVDTPSVPLLECCNHKLLLWSWLFRFG